MKNNTEDTIQNGVKHIRMNKTMPFVVVEDTIQNGVKHTSKIEISRNTEVIVVTEIIQTDTIRTRHDGTSRQRIIKDIIQKGLK